MPNTPDTRPHVVILGGGFAGLEAAKALRGKPVRVTLVDRTNHHTFQPLLYQVASGVLSPGQITAPLRHLFRGTGNVAVLMADATEIDLEARRVTLDSGHLDFDYLLVATGARHAYFGHPEWEAHAPGLKTVEDALEIRRRVLTAFEDAEREALLGAPPKAPVFVVVGAGPTGVELAGALADIARRTLEGNFRAIDPAAARVLLVEGTEHVLPTYPEKLSASARRQLESLGVEVLTGRFVTDIEEGQVHIGDESLAASVVLWATGVDASKLGASLAEVDGAGRVPVQPDLSLASDSKVFVAGDLARLENDSGELLPALAAVALQQGKRVAANILADLSGQERSPFHYKDRGTMATIGRRRAVADAGAFQLTGFVAWVSWLLIHVLLLIGFHNRLMVLREWGWAYFTQTRAARLITRREANRPPPG